MFLDQSPELRPGKMLQQLIEQTGCLYDGSALLFGNSVQNQPAANERILLSINYRRAFSSTVLGLNSKAVLDKSVFAYILENNDDNCARMLSVLWRIARSG
jgi:hypothetical protein